MFKFFTKSSESDRLNKEYKKLLDPGVQVVSYKPQSK